MDPLTLIALVFVIAVVIVLAIGLGGFTMDGKFNKKYANKMMRYRIIAQAIAVVVIMVVVAIKMGGGE